MALDTCVYLYLDTYIYILSISPPLAPYLPIQVMRRCGLPSPYEQLKCVDRSIWAHTCSVHSGICVCVCVCVCVWRVTHINWPITHIVAAGLSLAVDAWMPTRWRTSWTRSPTSLPRRCVHVLRYVLTYMHPLIHMYHYSGKKSLHIHTLQYTLIIISHP